jgi:hypothetical protein
LIVTAKAERRFTEFHLSAIRFIIAFITHRGDMSELINQIRAVYGGRRTPAIVQTVGIAPSLLARANAGDATSQRLVALAYRKGEVVPQDNTVAYVRVDGNYAVRDEKTAA